MRSAGEVIAEEVSRLTPSDLPVRYTTPIAWSFRQVQPDEEEIPFKGIAVVHSKLMSFEDTDREEALSGLPSQIQTQLDSAAAKFGNYLTHVKLVLLDFYCEDLSEEDVPPMMETISMPDNIDEVWRTTKNWISADEYEVGYDMLYKR